MTSDGDPVGMGLFFYPRGGSARVAGYLSRALAAHGWQVTLACGSLGGSGALGNAATVFAGLDIVPAAYDDAVARWERGEDPMDAPFPMHPSFEARAGVPDRGFPWVSPAQGERMAAAWASLIVGSGGMARARLLHLHHLTPIHDAVVSALPGVPVVTHLHGTELKMLDAITRAKPEIIAGPHAQWWASRMRAAAHRAAATITISPYDRGEAVRLLGLDPATVHWIPNGVDVERFTAHRPSLEERRSHWLRWLVRDPHGWDEATATPGSVAYAEAEVLDAFFDATSGEARPVLMFVGRFLSFKRVPLLIRAYARARERMSVPAPLVIWGGVPGEWEGEHPHTVATRERVDGVFFTGWRGHDQLPLGLNCADCFVAPSSDEPFGLVYLEAMACELPVIGTLSGGPPSFVNVRPGEPDGWLIPPDDEAALTDAMVAAIDAPGKRTQRGINAGRHAREGFSWHRVAGRLAALYQRHGNKRTSRHHH
ncbi:MAG: D-inositol-3-phosphate glycosyltransferase [Gaiellales bacterium]|nr:D-inositol-3-phosphate glycosyltransferase [Gaiellales bacterium]